MNSNKKSAAAELSKYPYSNFRQLNGEHPFKEQVPGGRVEYKARYRKGGKVAYFNFELAREMGLIPASHENILNPELEKEIVKTFGLFIINEYDIINNIKFPEEDILPNTYMATRYLQLQHVDKAGRTSGDGRSIWNGSIRHKDVTWDVSSCGTGGTKLSPATNINKKFYQTGDPTISYGCGLSEVSEGLETLFFSEVLAKNGFRTERILAIVEYEKGIAVNVRAYPNLMRPSHFFGHLKQGNFQTLKQTADYYIQRQIQNKAWPVTSFKSDKEKYNYLAQQVALSFAQTSARFEDEYIFCWMDWDGDNILMDGGIIDYGSIRQFGLFHAEYRFDDGPRFSTTIVEQRLKARYIVQCFAQIADFLTTGKKKSLSQFRKHPLLKYFDDQFLHSKNKNLLYKIGFSPAHQDYLIKEKLNDVNKFRNVFSYFERAQSKRGMYKVADGINKDAIFCMRDILREFPQIALTKESTLTHGEFIEVIKSSYAQKTDLKLTEPRKKQINRFQDLYLRLVKHIEAKSGMNRNQVLLELTMRSSVINKYDRVTGNSISFIIEKVQKVRPKLKYEELEHIVKQFSLYQNLNPDDVKREYSSQSHKSIMQGLHTIVKECREGL